MNEFDLCSNVATATVLFGGAAPMLRTTHATDEGIMLFGILLTVIAFLVGLAGV